MSFIQTCFPPEYQLGTGGAWTSGVATILTQTFTMPAVGATTTAHVENAERFKVGDIVYVDEVGFLSVTQKDDPDMLDVRNLGYAINKPPGTTAPSGRAVGTNIGPGPQGPQGPVGATGSIGPAGPAGATGASGLPSTVPGATGPAGATGPEGATGASGVPGATGPVGATGDPGPNIVVASPSPPATPNNGAIWTNALGEVFVWRDTMWFQIG